MTQATPPATNSPTQVFSDKLYNRLKLTAMIVLPALVTLYLSLAPVWDWPEKIGATLAAINIFVGGLVAYAKKIHEVSGAAYDGTLAIEEGEDTSTLRLLQVDPVALDTKNSITFKVSRPGA